MEKEKMPFHLTITDNETGETLRDLDFDVIIGAVHLSQGENTGIFVANSSTMAQAETIAAAETTVARTLKKHPMLCLAKGIVDAGAIEEVTEETEN